MSEAQLAGVAVATALWFLGLGRLLARWPHTELRWTFPLRLRGLDVVLAASCWI